MTVLNETESMAPILLNLLKPGEYTADILT